MRAFCALLTVLALAASPAAAVSFADFLQGNPGYEFISEGVPEILEPNAAFTIFVPLLNNVTGPEAAAYPQLSPNLVLPTVYNSAADLLAAGAVTNLGNVTITLEDNPGKGVIDATFVELGDATAKIYPVAFPLGNSVLYPITVISSGNVPQQVGASASTALAAALGSAQTRVGEAPPSFFTDVPSHDLKRVGEAAFKLAGAVLDGRARAGAVVQQLDGPVDRLAQLMHEHADDERQSMPPLPTAAARHAGQRWRLEACGALFAALHRVLYACWQRLESTEQAEEEGQGEQGGQGAAGGKPKGDESGEGGDDPQEQLEQAAYLLERVQNAWGAACCSAIRSLMQAGTPGSRSLRADRHLDSILRLTTCALACTHTILLCLDPPTTAAAPVPSPKRFPVQHEALQSATIGATISLNYLEGMAPARELGADGREGRLRNTPAARQAAAALRPFPAWAHAAPLLTFLEQAVRLLPHLQVLTDRPTWLSMPGSRTSQEDWMSLQSVMGSCATNCSCLLFMLSYQIPRPGEGGPEVEKRITSFAASASKLARCMHANGCAGPMWGFINSTAGSVPRWLLHLRTEGSNQPHATAEDQGAIWSSMHQPDSKLAALVYVYSDLRPLAERYQLGDPYNENDAFGTAVLCNFAGVAAARQGGLPLLASELLRLKDRVDIEWLAEVTSSLRFGGEADTQLYCWLAKECVLAALLEVAEVLGSRPGQWTGRNKETCGSALDSIYSITLRTARKADELTGSHLAEEFEHWVEGEVAPLLRRAAGALGPAFLGTTPAMFTDMLRNTVLVKPAFWKAIRRKHLPAILSALRTLPHAGCEPLSAGEAAAARDRTCAWLGCANPACRNTSGGSEAGMNVLRCGRCRVAGFCGSACQREASLAARWAAWRDSPWRRAVNEAGTSSDHMGHIAMVPLLLALLALKTWWREGLPVLALKAATFAVTTGVQGWLSGHKGQGRRIYMAYRELFIAASCLHLQWTVRLTALHGAVNTIDHHGGSALSLLTLLLGHTTALYGAMAVLHGRLVLPASCALVTLMASTTLWSGQRMCVRVLESPGVEEPLAVLHSLLGHALSLPLPHGTASFLTPQVSSPMQQCLVVSAWLELAVGAAAPLCILLWLEGRTRPHFEERQRRQQQQQQEQQQGRQQQGQQPQGWQQPHAEQPAAEEAAGEEAGGSEPKLLSGWSGAVVFYLLCSAAWCVLCSMYSGASL
ncbi:hypothetical protein C2E21_6731 [Chlorella sorokiniana]|uniref:Uncharacterized protein n=1 Tax=Chlorella sorokiniana TaxID=3076 RepID=A0A2P6TJN4_CHLSO|nr:hypothetical protein C2E21_6731 [Chlorella sorokiniana]|eukprot:PRW44275.1 hypothetical protein C2E21_6731 [Chlorella sorokiniana]